MAWRSLADTSGRRAGWEKLAKTGNTCRNVGYGGDVEKRGPELLWSKESLDNGTDLLTEYIRLGTAYAITKLLLPARIVLSVWATPWFARTTIEPIKGTAWKKISGFFRR